MIVAFIHGVILAIGLILPLGAQNMFIFSQGAVQRSVAGWLPVVVAAGCCDTLLILLAVGGVSVVVLSVAWLKSLLVAVGVIFLGYVGWLTWNSPVEVHAEQESVEDKNQWSLKRKIMFTLSVSLLNPHAILDTIGVIGTSSLSYTGDAKLGFTIACVLVSWIWFFLLANLGGMLREFDKTGRIMVMFNRISAVIMWVSAVYLIYSSWILR